ncbi:hypothetical protein [Streptomyces winkii]|uniref:hypothetical protein n=1 Tax=Streptomyces winkii TaxID=3051178 RepID=UPI0028D2C6FD|nr:hypothetical protein [Streptomyces sp. DSM 40971]
MADEERVERRLLLSVDARGYGSAPDWMHEEIQRGLLGVLDVAAKEAGLRRDAWDTQGAGDGELAVLPLEEPEVRVVERFPRELKRALLRHNRGRSDETRLRLRMAVHFGTAKPGSNGYKHAGPVVVSRLCDIEPLKRTLVASGADLAVVFSRTIYNDTVKSGLALLDSPELRQVRARNKEFDEDAWIWVPGYDVRALDLEDAPEEGTRPSAPTSGLPAPDERAARSEPSPGRTPGPEAEPPPSGGRAPLAVSEHDVLGPAVPAGRLRGFRLDED